MARIEFALHGKQVAVNAEPDMPLLYALRGNLEMKAPHVGCGEGNCGACTVLLDGEPVRSCVMPVSAVKGKKVTTVFGLGTPRKPYPLQTAFLLRSGACPKRVERIPRSGPMAQWERSA